MSSLYMKRRSVTFCCGFALDQVRIGPRRSQGFHAHLDENIVSNLHGWMAQPIVHLGTRSPARSPGGPPVRTESGEERGRNPACSR